MRHPRTEPWEVWVCRNKLRPQGRLRIDPAGSALHGCRAEMSTTRQRHRIEKTDRGKGVDPKGENQPDNQGKKVIGETVEKGQIRGIAVKAVTITLANSYRTPIMSWAFFFKQ